MQTSKSYAILFFLLFRNQSAVDKAGAVISLICDKSLTVENSEFEFVNGTKYGIKDTYVSVYKNIYVFNSVGNQIFFGMGYFCVLFSISSGLIYPEGFLHLSDFRNKISERERWSSCPLWKCLYYKKLNCYLLHDSRFNIHYLIEYYLLFLVFLTEEPLCLSRRVW